LFLINAFLFSKNALNRSNVTVNTFIMLQKKEMLIFWTLY